MTDHYTVGSSVGPNLATRLRTWRELRGIGIAHAAALAGVDRSTWRAYESGATPQFAVVPGLAKLLGMPVAQLMSALGPADSTAATDIGRVIRDWRACHALSLRRAAVLLDVAPSTVRIWEEGQLPRPAQLRRLHAAGVLAESVDTSPPTCDTVRLFVCGRHPPGFALPPEAQFMAVAHTAPGYRLYAVNGRYPAVEPELGGVSVTGALYGVDHRHLRYEGIGADGGWELDLVTLRDGSHALCVRPHPDAVACADTVDISGLGDWRSYLAAVDARPRDPLAVPLPGSGEDGLEEGVAVLNAIPHHARTELLLRSCNLALRAWADRVAAQAPFADFATLRRAAATQVGVLTSAEIVAGHKGLIRIGERGTDMSAHTRWSRAESAGLRERLDDLRAANALYERQFGHLFLIHATGRTGADVVTAIERRLRNDEATEAVQIKTEWTKLVQLRLGKLSAELAAGTPPDALIAR